MSQEGEKVIETDSSSESTLSPRSGKRLRDEKEEVLVPRVEARNMDLCGAEENSRKAPGKRIRCNDDTQHEKDADNKNASVKVAAGVSNKDQAFTSEIEGDAPFFCSVCCVTSTSKKDYDTHIAGKKHARAVVGVATPRSGKTKKTFDKVSKALPVTLHEDVLMEQPAMVDGSITNLEASKSPDKNGGNDMVVERHPKEAIFMESLGSQILRNEVALHDQGIGNSVQPPTNGHHVHNASADGLAKCGNNCEDQKNKSIFDFTKNKNSSDAIARALTSAYRACPCPGLESLLKLGTHDQAAGFLVPQAAGALSSNVTTGMVSMHTQCFMNLLHDVQVKGMEDLFLHVVRGEKIRGFTTESWLSNGATISAMPPGEDLNCKVCRVEYGSKSDLDRHVAGKKHASVVTRLQSRCHVCNVNCNSEKEFDKHVSGKKHASKLRLVQKRVGFEI